MNEQNKESLKDVVEPLVKLPTVDIKPRLNGPLSDSEIRTRCRKLANEILLREKEHGRTEK